MKGLDDFIEGRFDPNNPANQHEEESDDRTLEEMFNDNDLNAFSESVAEIRHVISRLREVAKASDNHYFTKKLTEIYQKL